MTNIHTHSHCTWHAHCITCSLLACHRNGSEGN